MIGRLHWIDREKLRCFILACQDEETGGFADRPGDMVNNPQLNKVYLVEILNLKIVSCLNVTCDPDLSILQSCSKCCSRERIELL